MYQKYQTDALVLRSYERGEADRVYALFTREFGYVWARASAVRREISRQRYALQTGSEAHVSLVRGNRGWRIAGASAEALLSPHKPERQAFMRMLQLLERLSASEESNLYLYETLSEARATLSREGEALYPVIELVTVARMLFALGYLSQEALGTALFAQTAFTTAGLTEAREQRQKLLVSVNKAISETQL